MRAPLIPPPGMSPASLTGGVEFIGPSKPPAILRVDLGILRAMAKTAAAVPDHLWAVPAFLEYVQPPLTDEAVAAAEAQLGVTLPATYLACLRIQNGGYLRRPRGVQRVIEGIGPSFPSITGDQAWWRPKNVEPGAWQPAGAELLIPFDGDGHWDLCFDYRACGPTGEPSITLVDVESESEGPEAPSFDGYLALPHDPDDHGGGLRVRVDVSAESVARTIARGLGRPEPTVDAFAHGYPQWRVQLHEDDPSMPERRVPRAWCWCFANRVPAGFRREGLEIITTPETALLFPDDAGCVVVVQCSGHQERVEEVLRAAALLP